MVPKQLVTARAAWRACWSIITPPEASVYHHYCAPGNIASWKKKVGDEVAAGDSLAEIETDKARPLHCCTQCREADLHM